MLRASDFRAQARASLTGNWGVAILTYLIAAVILGATGSTFVGTILLLGPMTVGLAVVYLMIVRRRKAEIVNVFDGFKSFVNALVGGLLYTVFLCLWALLFIIPAIIKSYSYAMTFYIMADHPEMDGNTAITESRKMMNGNKWRLFCLDFSFIGWIILSILTFGILEIVYVGPYMNAAHAAFYQSLKGEEPAADFVETKTAETTDNGTENI